MKRTFLILSILLVLALTTGSAAAAGKPLPVDMDWRNVVPAGSGDPNVFGDAKVWVHAGQGKLCWEIGVVYYASSWPPTGAFIYTGNAGQNGPAVIELGAPIPPPDSYIAQGCTRASTSLLKQIQQNPAGYYLQIVNDTHPDGATRGQLGN